jgi:TldD protein
MREEFPSSWIAQIESQVCNTRYYTDARIILEENLLLYLQNGILKRCIRGMDRGLGVRAITPHGSVFSSITHPYASEINQMFHHVARRSDTLPNTSRGSSLHVPTQVRDEFMNASPYSPREILEWLRERLPRFDNEINYTIVLKVTNKTQLFCNSEDAFLYYDVSRFFLHIGAVCKENHGSYTSSDVGGTGNLETLEKDQPLTEFIESVGRRASRLSRAHSPPLGSRKVLLDQKFSGLIAHEIGHLFEVDSNSNSNSLKCLNEITIPKIDIRDKEGPETNYGWTPVDDEGVKGGEVVLIKDGEIHQSLHTLQTAALTHEIPMGNGRAEGFDTLPQSRMRNTYLITNHDPWRQRDLWEESSGELFVEGGEGGIRVDSDHFLFYPAAIYRIGEKGDKEDLFLPTRLEGSVREILENIEAVGNDIRFFSSLCHSRNQNIPVSSGGPLMKTRLRIGG